LQEYIEKYTVAFFSKTFCPYCKKAKATLKELGIDESKIKILECAFLLSYARWLIDIIQTGSTRTPTVVISKHTSSRRQGRGPSPTFSLVSHRLSQSIA
jgi:glutaredoxin